MLTLFDVDSSLEIDFSYKGIDVDRTLEYVLELGIIPSLSDWVNINSHVLFSFLILVIKLILLSWVLIW